jgi:RimJ/RimL family protein N-acetyltransferase
MDDSTTQSALDTVRHLKDKPAARTSWIPIFQFGRKLAWLEPVTRWDLDQEESISVLSQWRLLGRDAAASRFPHGREGTWGWLARHVLEVPDRLLFWVKGQGGTPIGMVGLSNFDFTRQQVELDNLVRGQADLLPGVMYCSVQTLLGWTFQTFAVTAITVQVGPENVRAIRLFGRCGFGKVSRNASWGDRVGEGNSTATQMDRGVVTMSLSRPEWMAAHRLDKAA